MGWLDLSSLGQEEGERVEDATLHTFLLTPSSSTDQMPAAGLPS